MHSEALKEAARFLGRRNRLSAEVRAHLRAKGFSESDVEVAVSYLVERKLLNDENTTESLIERRSGKRSVGIERLRAELERLGAPEETIRARLEALDETERALEALRAKYRDGCDRARAGRFLVARGFGEDAVESALDRFCGDFPSAAQRE